MATYRLSAAAQADIVDILFWSQTRFGEAARTRYERLIVAALRDISADPYRPGSLSRSELGEGARSWHLRSSGKSATPRVDRVRRPRHFLIYRVEGGKIYVVQCGYHY